MISFHSNKWLRLIYEFLAESQQIQWSKRILVATHLLLLDPHHCFFQSSSFLNCSTIYYFWQFSGPKLPDPFWGPKRHFFSIEWSRKYESIPIFIFDVYGCSPWIDISNDVSCVSNGGSMPKLWPRELMYRVTQRGPHSSVSPPRVRFLDV